MRTHETKHKLKITAFRLPHEVTDIDSLTPERDALHSMFILHTAMANLKDTLAGKRGGLKSQIAVEEHQACGSTSTYKTILNDYAGIVEGALAIGISSPKCKSKSVGNVAYVPITKENIIEVAAALDKAREIVVEMARRLEDGCAPISQDYIIGELEEVIKSHLKAKKIIH